MTIAEGGNDNGINNTEPKATKIIHVNNNLVLLLHALYCTLCAQRETSEQAEGWYKATKIKFWLSGLSDSSIYRTLLRD